MSIKVEVNNKTQTPIEDQLFTEIARETIEKANFDFLLEKEIFISIALVSEEEIKGLNKKYRQKDSVTDVLSFFEYGSIEEIKKIAENQPEEEVFLGELVFCYEYIKKSAKMNGIEEKKELYYIISHGILHLLGFKHGDKMFSIQENVSEMEF